MSTVQIRCRVIINRPKRIQTSHSLFRNFLEQINHNSLVMPTYKLFTKNEILNLEKISPKTIFNFWSKYIASFENYAEKLRKSFLIIWMDVWACSGAFLGVCPIAVYYPQTQLMKRWLSFQRLGCSCLNDVLCTISYMQSVYTGNKRLNWPSLPLMRHAGLSWTALSSSAVTRTTIFNVFLYSTLWSKEAPLTSSSACFLNPLLLVHKEREIEKDFTSLVIANVFKALCSFRWWPIQGFL